MEKKNAGFKEIEHTADWALFVWAPTLDVLFAQAGLGMNALADLDLAPGPQISRHLEIDGEDKEILLVAFLSELLFIGENESLGFDTFEITLENDKMLAEITGAVINSREKEIKAVTFHNLGIKQRDKMFEVEIVFDV